MKIFHLFAEASLYASDGFVRTFHVSHHDHTISVDSDSGTIHMDDSDDTLKIYVPRDKEKRKLCYATQLGAKLAEYVQVNDLHESKTFCLVLTTSPSNVDAMLNFFAITPIDFGNSDSVQSTGDLDSESDSEKENDISSVSTMSRYSSCFPSSRPITVSGTSGHSPNSNDSECLPIPGPNGRQNEERRHDTLLSDIRSSTPSTTPLLSIGPADSVSETGNDVTTFDYTRLLHRVVNSARASQFPSIGPFDFHDLAAALAEEDLDSVRPPVATGLPFGSRTQNQIAHDIKIGAAGELYVRLLCYSFRSLQRLRFWF